MISIFKREFIYLWYYFTLQLQQILFYWILGMVLGSIISVFEKDRIHRLFASMKDKPMGILGVIPASALGILSPLCMYGTIPLASSFSENGMEDDWLAAFMMSSIPVSYTHLGTVRSTALSSGRLPLGGSPDVGPSWAALGHDDVHGEKAVRKGTAPDSCLRPAGRRISDCM